MHIYDKHGAIGIINGGGVEWHVDRQGTVFNVVRGLWHGIPIIGMLYRADRIGD